MKIILLAGLTLAALHVDAAVLTTENFSDYPTNPPKVYESYLGNQNGGTGWDVAWEAGMPGDAPWYSQVRVADGSNPNFNSRLFYPGHSNETDPLSYFNLATNNKSNYGARNVALPEMYADAHNQIGADGTSIWISFLYRRPVAQGAGTLQFWTQRLAPQGTTCFGVPLPSTGDTDTNLVIVKFAFGENDSDTATVWLNPDASWGENNTSPFATRSGNLAFIRLAWIIENPPANAANDALIADIRMGNTAPDVSRLCIPRGTTFLLR